MPGRRPETVLGVSERDYVTRVAEEGQAFYTAGMGDRTAIEWADTTWNPVTGCTQLSPGCDHCYALAFAERFRGVPGHPYQQGFDLKLWPERLTLPLTWKRPRRIFVNSMSDLFHEAVPEAFIHEVFNALAQATWSAPGRCAKRPRRMSALAPKLPSPENIWVGTSVELDGYAWRGNACLRDLPAAVRFGSAEPLLGPLPPLQLDHLHRVIAGGESGPHFRPCDPIWMRDLRDQCLEAGVAFILKQWSGGTPRTLAG